MKNILIIFAVIIVLLLAYVTLPTSSSQLSPADVHLIAQPIQRTVIIIPATLVPTDIPIVDNTPTNDVPADRISGPIVMIYPPLSYDKTSLEAATLNIYNLDVAKFGHAATFSFTAAYMGDPACILNGITSVDYEPYVAQVFTCDSIDPSRAEVILAHEMGHILSFSYYGDKYGVAEQRLTEGLATWIAGDTWQIDYRHVSATYSLSTNDTIGGTDYTKKNQLYKEWASFVEFLISTYGRDKFDQLFITGDVSTGTSDYIGIYGKSNDELEQEWLSWLQ